MRLYVFVAVLPALIQAKSLATGLAKLGRRLQNAGSVEIEELLGRAVLRKRPTGKEIEENERREANL
ncbi:unnamed protein product [Cylicostephanus goldi]|uniref:Uncharacterized protein n=1 Tax=Cylicostephanus goldi TaxID=71465 RepID=A0A3P7N2Q9_CYLGO|nr:unnamed protein product [Cylicostephanus goldi]